MCSRDDWPALETVVAGIDLSRRAETLSVEEFAHLSDAMARVAGLQSTESR